VTTSPILNTITIYPNLILPREALGIDKSIDILHHIRDLPTAEDQAAAVEKIRAVERKAMLEQQPQPGLARLMDYLKSRSLRRGLCTRNFEYAMS
jgi:phosphoglycolate phosphatase-like HAD superfamily hydrolase